MAQIALGNTLLAACADGDAHHDGRITVDEIMAAVDNALNECAGAHGIAFSEGQVCTREDFHCGGGLVS